MSDRPNQGKQVVHRLTVVMSAYHQIHGGDAIDVRPAPFDRELNSDEEIYQRTTKIGTEIKPLDLGWVKETPGYKVAMICIENLELKVNAQKSIDLIAKGAVMMVVPAGEAIFFTPADPLAWSMRSRAENTQFRISVIPG